MDNSKNGYILSCKIEELLYYLYFAIMLFAKGMGLYEGMILYNISLLLGTSILVLKFAAGSYSLKEIGTITALVLLGVLVWRSSGEKGPLLYLLLIIGMKSVPVKRVFKVGLLVWSSTFVIQILLALSGVRSGVFVAHEKLGLGHIIRWSLGYPHPNVLHISYVILIAFVLYVLKLKGRKLIFATAFCFIGNLYIFMYSISYTGLILTTVYLIFNFYFSCRDERTKAENILVETVFPMCVAFSVLGPLVFKGKLFEICDKILNTRFYLSNRYLTDGNWSLFGNAQPEMRAESINFTLDCSYTYLLMYCGGIIFIIMCFGYVLLIRRYIKEKKGKELAIILGLAVAGISEPFLFNTAYKNLTFIFMGSYLFEYLEVKNNKNVWKLRILPFGDRTIYISYEILARIILQIKQTIKEKGKKIAAAGVLFGLLTGILYAVTADVPDSIYMLKKGNDRYDKVVYLDINNLPDNFNSRIVSYQDEKTPMYEFEGNMVMVEYVRGIVSSAVAGGVVWSGIYSGVCVVKCSAKKKERKRS